MAVDVSKLDVRIRREVERRGLFLVVPDPQPEIGTYIYVCTAPNPRSYGRTRVGFVVLETGSDNHIVYAMNGENTRYDVGLHQIRGYCQTWEQAIQVVLGEFDRWGGSPSA